MFDSLRSLSDHQLLANTDSIIVQDRKLTLELLIHLREIERRRLYLKRGFGSMFDYCTRHLRLSEPAAVRRIKTARCLARFSELYSLLESGEVSLTTVSLASRVMNPPNKDVLIERIRGKSKREVQAIVAEYEPRASVPPDRLRTVVVPVVTAVDAHLFTPQSTVSGGGKKSSIAIDHEDRRAGDRQESRAATVSIGAPLTTNVAQIGSSTNVPAPTLERRALVQFSAREIVISKLERVRAIASHRLPANAPLEQVIEFLADYFTEREDPAKRHDRREERKQRTRGVEVTVKPPTSAKQSRHVPVAMRDEVFARDRERCTYRGPNGEQCGSTRVLQVDHIQPFARGGASTADNLRLLCAQHNRLEAERLLGRCGPPERPR